MKRTLFSLLAFVIAASACSLATPTPPSKPARLGETSEVSQTSEVLREQAPAPTEAAPTSAPAVENPTGATSAPGAGQVDITQLVETDTDFLGMYKDDKRVYDEVMDAGGRIVNLESMDAFFILWVPEGYEQMDTRRVMVVAHGHTGSSYFQMAQELPFARKYGYAVVSIQWWTGEGEEMHPAEHVFTFMDTALRYMAYKYDAQLDKSAYRGWSQGSEISFQLAYLDRVNGTDYLRLLIAHDGGMKTDPSEMSVGKVFTTDLYNGVYGEDAFAGKHFYLYAGDEKQAENMRNTVEVITSHGGIVERYVEDIGAGHGGFFEHPQYHEDALEIFLQLAP